MSKFCPHLEFVQTLSDEEVLVSFEDLSANNLDKPWIFMYKVCPNLALLDRPMTDIVPLVDSVWTDTVHGQALDSVLTYIGQRLDFTSNLCLKFVCPLFSKEYRQILHLNKTSRRSLFSASPESQFHLSLGEL